VTITGSSEAPKRLFAKYRPAGGAPCAVSYSADSGSGLVSGEQVNGAFTATATLTPSDPGDYLICMWLADSSSDGSPVAGPQPAPFPGRPPWGAPRPPPGSLLADVTNRLTAAHCAIGAQRRQTSHTVKRGRVIRLARKAGDTLTPGTPIAV